MEVKILFFQLIDVNITMLAILAVISIEKPVKCPGFTCLLRLKNHIEKKRLFHQATLVLEILSLKICSCCLSSGLDATVKFL